MRIRRIFIGLISIGVVFAVGIPAAFATPVTQVIKVTTSQTSNVQHGCCTIGITGNLIQHGKTVGSDAVTCTLSTPSIAVSKCIGALTFDSSGVMFFKATLTNGNGTGAIMGGTGAFTDAKGTFLKVKHHLTLTFTD
jgi:hypothetical protein